MHEYNSAELLALFPLHVQLTKNHIHVNEVSHKRPVDNTRTEVVSFVIYLKRTLIITKLALFLH